MTTLSRADKVRLLRELTLGAPDVFAMRGENFNKLRPEDSDDSWRPVYSPVRDSIIELHLAGQVEIGSYPMIPVDRDFPQIHWIAADFDGKRPGCDWERDVQRTVSFLHETGCTMLVNLSRSAFGAHVRVLFKEAVPAWLARRWMQAWLEEAGVAHAVDNTELDMPTSFDRLIPPQDTLLTGLTKNNQRRPGNLVGSPLNAARANGNNGATLPLSIEAVLDGDYRPDGKHWEHTIHALDSRSWGRSELMDALIDSPGTPDLNPPSSTHVAAGGGASKINLPVLQGDNAYLDFTLKFCEFMKFMASGHDQPYHLWVALASQLHRWGEDGRRAFHSISQLDRRYEARETDRKWEQTADLRPMRCDTIAGSGWRCPHLEDVRCGGAKTPSYFYEHVSYEAL
jgi:hypothetical protein